MGRPLRNKRKDRYSKGFNDYRINNARNSNAKRYPNGYLYVLNIVGTDYYKIGVSQNINRRVRDLESATPFEIEVIYCQFYEGVYELEKQLHEFLKEKYVKSEWFMMKRVEASAINKIIKDQIILESKPKQQIELF